MRKAIIGTTIGIMFVIALFSGLGMGQTPGETGISLTLSPQSATNPVGEPHKVTAKLLYDDEPLEGLQVTISILSGPNGGSWGSGPTNQNGEFSLTYSGSGTGIDKIQASYSGNGNEVFSNIVEKEWVKPYTKGFMTGGGSVFKKDGSRVTHGFELNCDKTESPNNLEVNWGNGNKFHLEKLTSALCYDSQAIDPKPPKAGFDTYKGSGIGRYNGVDGATATWTFTDAGEPGKDDTATISIKDVDNNVVLVVSGKLDKGNQQAHN